MQKMDSFNRISLQLHIPCQYGIAFEVMCTISSFKQLNLPIIGSR